MSKAKILAFATVLVTLVYSVKLASQQINNQNQKHLVRLDEELQRKTSYEVGFQLWCTPELCSVSSLREEDKKKRALLSEGVKNRNCTVHYLKETLSEQSFMELFYSPPSFMHKQPLVVVTTSYGYPSHYPLNWIDMQPWPVFISTKEKDFGVASEPWGNKGREIASYLRFILLFWQHLPERIAFVHGHEKAWHQEGYRMSYMLRNVCFKSHDYISLSPFENDAWRPIKGSMTYYTIIRKNWHRVELYLGKFPKSGFKEKCCAQFVVSREKIRKQPRELYELMLMQTLTHHQVQKSKNQRNKRFHDIGYFWEAIWHYIFGEQAIVNTKRKYGFGTDKDIETGRLLSKRPERTLKNVIACPNVKNSSLP